MLIIGLGVIQIIRDTPRGGATNVTHTFLYLKTLFEEFFEVKIEDKAS
jgi:hypothetical protein